MKIVPILTVASLLLGMAMCYEPDGPSTRELLTQVMPEIEKKMQSERHLLVDEILSDKRKWFDGWTVQTTFTLRETSCLVSQPNGTQCVPAEAPLDGVANAIIWSGGHTPGTVLGPFSFYPNFEERIQ